MRPSHALGLLLALTLVACGGGGTTPSASEPPPAAVPLADLVDPNAVGIVRVDITAASQSQHYQTFVDLLSLSLEVYDPSGGGILQLLLRSQEMVMFITRDGDEIKPVLLLRGQYSEGDARRAFPGDEDVRETEEHGIRMLSLQDGIIAAVGDHTIILGRSSVVRATIDRQLRPGTGHYPNENAFGALLSALHLESAQFGYAVSLDDAMKREIASEVGIPEAVLAPFTGLGMQATLTTGLEVRATLTGDSSVQAAALLLIANQLLARLRQDDDLTGLGFQGVLGAIMLRRDGGNLVLSMSMSDEQVRSSAAQIQTGIRNHAEPPSGSGSAPAPAP